MHNFAGRVGQWSANHWKTAVLAWLIFVVGAVFVGNMVGTKQIKQNEATVGESHKADRILDDAKFTVEQERRERRGAVADRCSSSRRP